MLPNYLYTARSHFSIGESLLSPKKIARIAKHRNFDTVALVDTMSISGMTDFIAECKAQEIRPIIGCRLRVVMDLDYRKPAKSALELPKKNPEWYPKVFVKNDEGMCEIMRLLSLANSSDRFFEKARLSLEDLLNVLKNGNLIFTTGDFQSVFTVSENDYNFASILDKINAQTSHENRFCELFNAESILCDTLNKRSAQRASDSMERLIMTNLMLYDEERDADTLDVLSVITSNAKIADSWRNKQWVKSFYAKDHEQIESEVVDASMRMAARMAPTFDWDELKAGIQAFKDACQYEWKPMPVSLPRMADSESMKLAELLKEGWKERIRKPVLGYTPSDELLETYKSRLVYEVSVLKRMGFERYFLLVHDVVSWSKKEGILVGPGRGSCGGSLVAFLLGITDVDPIRFNLLFERFINPDRLDLPDADLDFMSTRRGEVIDYLVGKYGSDRVAGISNYSTLASASALRDCGRVYGLTNDELTPTRFVPKENGKSYTLTDAAATVPDIEAFKHRHPDVWNHALGLEGCMRALGTHAAGIVVADEPITNRAVVETRSGTAVVNWDRNSVESWGLVKMDILGLNTLDTLRVALDYIKENRGEDVNLISLPIDDYKTMKGFSEGRTVGVFQMESSGMRHLLKELATLETLTFEDVCATTALYRPGPMDSGMLDSYIDFKKGNVNPTYDHEKMKPALEVTGGVFIYQEQVMQVARDLAGYSMADADKLRKIMGKKQREEMEKQREKFVEGCVKYSEMKHEAAGELFDTIASFAGYGFNRSHSVEYSIITYWSMYLKTHYSAEFFAAILTTADSEEKLQAAILDAARYSIFVVPPDINLSTDRFEFKTVEGEVHLITPFNKLKGFSHKSTEAILEAREKVGGYFESKQHLLENVRRKNCNIRHADILDKVGAFASLETEKLPARHPDRIKDQIELMPGLVCEYVKADRYTNLSDVSMQANSILKRIKSCKDCSLKDEKHCIPVSGDKIKFMVITDSPNWTEVESGKMLKGKGSDYLVAAMKNAGIKRGNGYFTSLVKAQKPKELKSFANETLLACQQFIDEEVRVVKPAVIVCLGGASIRHFLPDIKGGWSELAGRVIYSKELDASIVLGPNPMMAAFRDEVPEILESVFRKVFEIVE